MNRTTDTQRAYETKRGRRVVIRDARLEDSAAIIRSMRHVVREGDYLEEEADELNSINDERREIERIQRNGGLYAVAEMEAEIAGVLQLKRGELEMNRHIVDLRIWLAEAFRGLGIGRLLMEYAVDWAAKRRFHKITLDVFSNNDAAIALYRKFGFVTEGRRKEQFVLNNQFVDELFMSKFL